MYDLEDRMRAGGFRSSSLFLFRCFACRVGVAVAPSMGVVVAASMGLVINPWMRGPPDTNATLWHALATEMQHLAGEQSNLTTTSVRFKQPRLIATVDESAKLIPICTVAMPNGMLANSRHRHCSRKRDLDRWSAI